MAVRVGASLSTHLSKIALRKAVARSKKIRAFHQVAGQHALRGRYKKALARKLTSGSITKGQAKTLLKRSGGRFFGSHRRDSKGRFA